MASRIGKSAAMRNVFLLSWLAYTCSYFGRYDFSAAINSIITDGLLDKPQCGTITMVFFIIYGCGQLVNGFLSDKFSPYKMIFIGTFVSGLANIAMSFMNGLVYGCVVWGINGFAQSMLWSPIIFIISNSFYGKQLSHCELGMSATIPAGTLAAYGLSAVMIKYSSWKNSFLVAGIVLLAVSAVWAMNSVIIGSENRAIRHEAKKADAAAAPFFRTAVTSGVLIMFPAVLLHATLKDGVMTWVPTMISEVFKVPDSFSVTLALVLPIVNFFGSIIVAGLYTRLGLTEAKIASLFFAFTCLPLAGLIFIDRLGPFVSVALLALITSSMYAANYIFLTLVPVSYARLGRSASFAGTLDAVAYCGSAVSSYGFGSLAQKVGWNSTITLWLVIAAVALVFCLASVKKWGRFKAAASE